MSTQPLVVFQQTVQTLIHALGPALDETCAARLREVGIDVRAPLEASYSAWVWAQALRVAAETLLPGAPLEEALREVGRRFAGSFGRTLMGRAVVSLARVVGPDATMRRMTQNFRSGNNYTRCELEQLGSRHYRMRSRPVHVPGFHMGILEAGLRIAGATAVDVRLDAYEGGVAVFEVRWD